MRVARLRPPAAAQAAHEGGDGNEERDWRIATVPCWEAERVDAACLQQRITTLCRLDNDF